VRNGYQVLDRNWRCDTGEVDLVVSAGNTIVFVEVKARANDRYGSPALAVDHRKQRRLRLLAARWLSAMSAAAPGPIGRHEVRFDVVAITGTTIEVFESAF
jgi:putative endonuclease